MAGSAILLMGPTGAGKTDAALALAARLPVEIVSVDSAMVYRGLDIGTAKPAPAVTRRVPHHLIDIRDPSERYSAGEFVRDAGAAMAAIRARGLLPLLVGGTMLYFRALQSGLAELPGADAGIRARLAARAAAEGWPALHATLAAIDPAAARRIRPSDAQRIQRALEVHALTGTPLSVLPHAPRATLRCDACGRPRGGGSRAAGTRRPRPLAAGDALGGLPPALGPPRRRVGPRHRADGRHPRDPSAGQAPVHVAARRARRRVAPHGGSGAGRGPQYPARPVDFAAPQSVRIPVLVFFGSGPIIRMPGG
jgi:hypothetical protein